MIRVIGNNGCSRCEVTKQILNNKGVEFEYELLINLSEDEQDSIMKAARDSGKMALPIILKNNKIVDVKEI